MVNTNDFKYVEFCNTIYILFSYSYVSFQLSNFYLFLSVRFAERNILYEMYLQASGIEINIIPEQKICSSCYMKLLAVEENETLQHDNSTEEVLECDTEDEILEEICQEIEKQNLSVCFSSVGISLIKLHS